MRKPSHSRLAVIILIGFLPVLAACLLQGPREKNRQAMFRIARIYLGSSDAPVPWHVYSLHNGNSVFLEKWWGYAVDFPLFEQSYPTGMGLRVDLPTKDEAGNTLRPYPENYVLNVSTKSKDYPLDLSFTYRASTSQSPEPIIEIKRRITIKGPNEIHALRSDDGKWLILFRWDDPADMTLIYPSPAPESQPSCEGQQERPSKK